MQSVQQLLYSTCCISDHTMMCNPSDTVIPRCTDIYRFRCRLNCLHTGSRVFIPVSPPLSQITAKVVDSFLRNSRKSQISPSEIFAKTIH